MASNDARAVRFALIGNTFLTAIKFVAFLVSGSGAMLSESIHSAADAGNQFLLWLGVKRSVRPADDRYQFGYGNARFLYALFSAIGIFVLGAGFTIYHGVDSLLHPHEISVGWVTWTVLSASLLIEGAVLYTAVKEVHARRGKESFWSFLKTSSDPTLLAVLFEDAVACLGVLVAAIGLGLAQATGDSTFDAISSIAIGGLLGLVAIWLGWRNTRLILGPAIPPDVQQAVMDYLDKQDSVLSIREVRTRLMAADHFRFQADLDYDGRTLGRAEVDWVRSALPDSSDDEAVQRFAEDFGERVLDALGREVDRIEKELRSIDPRLTHLDFESD